jgi:hypothetical protein
LSVIAYRKFSDVLQNEDRAAAPPKPAKVPKADPIELPQARTLGELGALGGVVGETKNPPAPADTAPSIEGETEAEHAVIIEHGPGVPRAWAVGFDRLDPDQPPGDVPARHWQRFVDDVGSFLDSPFCAAAEELGWGPFELFGCDRDRPFARIDRAGLLWLLNGQRLVALSENTATIETRAGARQTYRRKPGETGRVLAWDA